MKHLTDLTPRTISLGKYGAFPSNLIIERPLHLTYEVQEKREGESFSRLRIVPACELHADALADTEAAEDAEDGADVVGANDFISPADNEELTLVDETGQVIARSRREILDDSARQTLTWEEIEELKRKGTSAGKDLIAKLMLSHSAIDQKTVYSLAKYKILKTKKYIRRFTVLPLDVPLLAYWLLEDRNASKILEMRQEALALVGCWADVHFADLPAEGTTGSCSGRWLVVDDTSGLLVASLADRMDILYPREEKKIDIQANQGGSQGQSAAVDSDADLTAQARSRNLRKRPYRHDFDVHYASTNTITVLHSSSQPNLALLRYFDFDCSDPSPPYPYHPLFSHLLPISWLQLLHPEDHATYADAPPQVEPEVLASWKTSQRGNYHRKRRRWARMRHIIHTTRAGNFSGLAVASTMDPISILRHTLPLLSGGAPIAIYSPNVEPLAHLADCFSISRRASWISAPPTEAEGRTVAELEHWEGTEDFPLNPTLLLGATIQSSRARKWQVLPGRTHPVMTSRGGAEGYVFTGWRVLPVDGKIEARGKYSKRRGDV